ncbi:MAG: hypothetical protein JSS75_05990 [Bacteroidetes bacterium]|nr:hypothetical protein [Bacteroidota bacterium]
MTTRLLITLIGLFFFQQKNENVNGWYKSTWGIDRDSISKLFPEATTPQHRDNVDGIYTSLEMRDYDIAGYKFTVAFRMDAKTKSLICVRMTYLAEYPGLVFDKFNEMLTSKYGSPSSKEDNHSYGIDKIRIWSLAKTTIKLEYENNSLLQCVVVHYNMKRDSESSKF